MPLLFQQHHGCNRDVSMKIFNLVEFLMEADAAEKMIFKKLMLGVLK